ncbi:MULTISPECIES: ABC transporter ATP-binding protein [Paenibacillus]|uniref:Carnitine transport ATP-binding protein OpuCA n=1 Tax=Paenibacillus naphthalenovorans TaxID=162209 RepID=A0A0U2VRF6_9BACL|nr:MULTISPECIES: ABC transporter ATP-binding protein [Paenibacillus]ALS23334.1 ABC transporter [Paenibacillus naphthalenovorans]
MQIHIQGLTKNYAKSRGITGIDLLLPQRGLTAIVGPSGCGKTTLLRTLAGFLQPDSGSIHFGERDVTRATPQERGAAMVFQNYALWPHMSVFDNVAYGLKLRKIPPKEREEKVFDVLRRVEIDLTEVRKRKPQQYSGGQQQRIALARALVVQPDLLLMDEPLSNLDAKVRQRLRVEIRSIQQAFGITALYVTHDQEEALSMADYVVVMNEGRIEQAGTPEEVYRKPATYFTAQFLGESHTLQVMRDGKRSRLVLRSDDAKLIPVNSHEERGATGAEAHLPASGGLPQVRREDGGVLFLGEVKSRLFVGSAYRHMVTVNGQTVFVDDEAAQPEGTYWIRIPDDKAYWFEETEERNETGGKENAQGDEDKEVRSA